MANLELTIQLYKFICYLIVDKLLATISNKY